MESVAIAEDVCNHTDAWDWVYTMQPAYMSIICLLGVIGNSFVLCVFCLQKRRSSVADIYLGNLAAADLLMVSCLPFWVATVIHEFHWRFGEPMCQLVNIVIGMNYYCSVLFLTLVSVDRYLALTRPLSQGRQRRAAQARGMCLGIWVVGVLLSLPALLFRSVEFFPDLGVDACYMAYPHVGWRLRFNMTVNVVGFIIPVPVVSFCSYHIVKVLRDSQVMRECSRARRERKAAYLVLVVLAVFVLSWLPYQILTFLDTLDYYQVISGCMWAYVLDIGTQLATYLGYSNSSLNPFLYVIVGKHFKQRAREVFRPVLCSRKWKGRMSSHINANLNSTIKYTDCTTPIMEPVTVLWFENSSASLSPSTTGFPVSTEWDLIHAILPPYILTLCVFGLLANSFVLLVFLLHKDRLTIPEIYLGNLALADFFLLCCLPFWAMNIHNHFNWPYGDFLCKVINSSVIVNFYTSIYVLVMISIDRYLAFVKTMTAQWLRRARHAKVICVILWLFGLLMSMPTMVHRKVKFIEEHETLSCILDHDDSWKLAHQILMNVVGFVLPVLVIVFCSGNIIRALNKRRESVGFHESNDMKAVALIYAVKLLFLLCWGPFQIFTFLDILCDVKVLDEELWAHTLDVGGQVSVYMAFLNSALNPVLYVFSGQYFKRKVSAICRKTGHQRRGSDMSIYQRSVISTYVIRPEQIKLGVILNAQELT
ncbi:B1 bradykinin receptor [Diretmus argenteus]